MWRAGGSKEDLKLSDLSCPNNVREEKLKDGALSVGSAARRAAADDHAGVASSSHHGRLVGECSWSFPTPW